MTIEKNRDKKQVNVVHDEVERRKKTQKRKIKDDEEMTNFYEQMDDVDDELYSLLKKIK